MTCSLFETSVTSSAMIQKNFEFHSCCWVIFLDISKAFDTVNHQLLLSRLREFGLDTATCGRFSSYHADKCQTCINAVQSEEIAVDTGAPQGSVLGPLLFSLFVNNLPAQLQGVTTVLFADDTSLYIADRSTEDISSTLTRALGSAHKWLLDSGLKLNVGKTRCTLISFNW